MYYSYSEESRLYMVIFLVFVCIVMGAILQSMGADKVYTHLFYIPIVFSAIWWQWKGLATAFVLSASLMCLHLIFRPEVSIMDDLLRGVMFMFVAAAVGEMSHLEKDKARRLQQEKERLEKSLAELETSRKKLMSSNIELGLKEYELDKYSVLFKKRKEKLERLAKLLSKAEKERAK